MWIAAVAVRDVRNLKDVSVDLGPGLNVFAGSNAQGKTTLLEAVGLLARGRSFRTDDLGSLIRRGADNLCARAAVCGDGERRTALEIELSPGARRLKVDGREVAPRDYHGRLEAIVYSTERLKVVRGTMRDRRLFFDRSAAALWPSYRHTAREYERVVQQRSAALEAGAAGLAAWDERLVSLGARLRHRRAAYLAALDARLGEGYAPQGERYAVRAHPAALKTEAEEEARLGEEMEGLRLRERKARRTLVGPHRDTVTLEVDGEDAARSASSGQVRSLLLALALAMFEVYRRERGTAPVALLDDLDSELDQERVLELCRVMAERGQALVTTAHPGWARTLGAAGRLFHVEDGRVRAA